MIPDTNQLKQKATEWFPLVENPGLPDFSCTIHSFGCTFWTALGLDAGYSALCEMPAPNAGAAALKGVNVISDSAWFQREHDYPEVLVEFERYSDATDAPKLRSKVENLLLGYWRWDCRPKLLVLAYWTKGLRNLPDHKVLRDTVRNGFTTVSREKVEGTTSVGLRFFQFIFEEQSNAHWRLTRIIERGAQ